MSEVIANGNNKIENVTSKNFRHYPDILNFYRFIHDNSLRLEAKSLLGLLLNKPQGKAAQSKGSGKKSAAKKKARKKK